MSTQPASHVPASSERVSLELHPDFYERYEAQATKKKKPVKDEIRWAVFCRRTLERTRDDPKRGTIELDGERITPEEAGGILELCNIEYEAERSYASGEMLSPEERFVVTLDLAPAVFEDLTLRAMYEGFPDVPSYILGAMIVGCEHQS